MKPFLYWFGQLTWGCLLTVPGAILTFLLILTGHKPRLFGYSLYVEIGRHWGGFNLGGFFFVQKGASQTLKSHEYGHAWQNLWFGPLMPILITIPSAVRYHYRNVKQKQGHALPPYDAFWCERWATELGRKYYKK